MNLSFTNSFNLTSKKLRDAWPGVLNWGLDEVERQWGWYGELVGLFRSGDLVWRIYTYALVASEIVCERNRGMGS
ncbi:MAG: hypothetical protein AAF299_09195, partial [Pseudomonadota bacterium]